MDHHNSLEEELLKFQRVWCNPTDLWIPRVRFNRTTVERLTEFLRQGKKNRVRQPVRKLTLAICSFEDDESLSVFCRFFAANESPVTLEEVSFYMVTFSQQEEEEGYERLISAFHHNRTVQMLDFSHAGIPGAALGAMVGALLLNNTHLTGLDLGWCTIDVASVRAMRQGLLASRHRLKRLGFARADIGNEVLNELRVILAVNDDQQSTVLSELYLFDNDNVQGLDRGISLRRLLTTFPGLNKLHISSSRLGPEGTSALFQADFMGRLELLNLHSCAIGHVGLSQLYASIPDADAPLVHLNIANNNIHGQDGGEILARILRRCGKLKVLGLSGNRNFGPNGARALAPALLTLHGLGTLDLSGCGLENAGARAVLASLKNTIPCLKAVLLSENNMSTTSLLPLAEFVKRTDSCLETLRLGQNNHLFGASNNSDRRAFFGAIAKHKTAQYLDISNCGLDTGNEAETFLVPCLQQNTTLLHVEHAIDRLQATTADCMRRNLLISNIDVTMEKPGNVPHALWPVALDFRLRGTQFRPTVAFWLVQKMKEANVFGVICERQKNARRIQRWWRPHRPSMRVAFVVRKKMRGQVAALSNANEALRERATSLLHMNEVLTEQNESLNEQNESLNEQLTSLRAELATLRAGGSSN